MNFDGDFVRRYSKKIMGFAYQKTSDSLLAEDLAQEILTSLASALRHGREIADMDGFVYTVCCYTWSRYLDKNKRHWNNYGLEQAYELASAEDVEETVAKAELLERMRAEIAGLSKLHRRIVVLRYYEGKTSEQITAELGINASTVRWHLGEIRKKLREGILMTQNDLSYSPGRLRAGIYGMTKEEYRQCGLGEDRLVDNICLACYGNPLTVEELSRKLSVAAAYLENHLERLTYMDYLVLEKGRYCTNFFIQSERHQYLKAKYHCDHIAPIADRMNAGLRKHLSRIKAIGFAGSDLDDEYLMWTLLGYATRELYHHAIVKVLKMEAAITDTPLRKDGSRHWVWAKLADDSYHNTQTEFPREVADFMEK